jgi:GAF domain-containing protein
VCPLKGGRVTDCFTKVDDDLSDSESKITESLQIMKIRSAMCIPISSHIRNRGALYVDALETPNAFRRNDLALLKDVSGRAALAMENIELTGVTLDHAINH